MSVADLFLPGRPNLRVLASTPSTNAEARRWVEEGAPDGALVVADEQTAGRGRLDRSWHSPPGVNLYLSCVLHLPEASLRLAPLLAAVATREAVDLALEGQAQAVLKWPNDILVSELKVAGILVEGILGSRPAAVLGIGVNLNMEAGDFPDRLRRPAGSLRMIRGRAVDRRSFLESLIEKLDRWRERARMEPAALIQAVRAHCATLGKRVTVQPPGSECFTGTARLIDADGSLVVERDAGGLIRVEAGDVDPVE